MLKEPRNTWRARERPVMPSARVRCFCASKSLKTGDDIYVFFSTLILYICSQGSVDCKSIPIYTLSESMDIEIPNDYPFCSSHARGSFATRLLRTATPTASTWCVGFWGRSLRSREARMSLDIFSQRTTWDRLWVSHNLRIHRY